MAIAVRTESADDGLVVVKEARTEGDVARLAREASMLTRAAQPGVVEVLDTAERTLRLRHAGTTLSRLGRLPVSEVAGILSALADVVEALHRAGVVHADIDTSHVLVDDRGRPRLCGFGRATDHSPAGAADDVAALGRLLERLLRASEDVADPAGRRARSRMRKELATVVAQATRPEPGQRPSARQLAKAIHAAAPSLQLPRIEAGGAPRDFAAIPTEMGATDDLAWTDDDLSFLFSADHDEPSDADDDDAPTERPDPYAALAELNDNDDTPAPPPAARPDPRPTSPPAPPPPTDEAADVAAVALPASDGARRPRAVSAVLGALVLVAGVVAGVLGARALDPFGGDTADDAPADVATDPDTGTDDAAVDAPTPPTWPATCTVPEPTGPDIDGDGCPEPVSVAGRTAVVGDRTVELGRAGDRVTLGDWTCDGIDTPALLRPSSGEIFVFPEWQLDEPVEVPATLVVPDATALEAGSQACPSLVARTPDGTVDVIARP